MTVEPIPIADSIISDPSNRITLTLPARPEFFVMARMSASIVASRLEFDLDEVEDLKLAVNELCTLCAAGSTAETRIQLEYSWDDDSVEIACEGGPVVDRPLEVPDVLLPDFTQADLAERLLSELVDEHECRSVEQGVRRASLRKRRSRDTGVTG